jgi:hypothetical protein
VKTISVKLVGTTIDPFSIQVNPGDTAGDILSRLNLGPYVLAIPPAPNRFFAPDEAVYEELLEDDYLLAVPAPSPSATPLKPVAITDTQAQSLKRLKIRFIGSKRAPVHIQIRPGTTVAHVLAYLKLSKYILVPASTEDLPKEIFDGSYGDDLYEKTQDGDKLIAIPAFEAGRIAFSVLMQKHSPKETIQ